MQTDNRFLDDFARVAASVVGTLQNVRGDVSTRLRQQFERILANMDLVTREEFEAVKAMAAVARAENEALAARLEALEGGPRARPKAGAAKRAAAGEPRSKAAAVKRAPPAKKKSPAKKAPARAGTPKPRTRGRKPR